MTHHTPMYEYVLIPGSTRRGCPKITPSCFRHSFHWHFKRFTMLSGEILVEKK